MHTFYWGDWYDEIIDPEFAAQISPIEVGKVADFVITSDNPLAVDPMEINENVVMETIKDGESVSNADRGAS